MNICIALWFRAPLGGLQDNVRQTVAFLMQQDAQVTVLCPSGPFSLQLQEIGADVVETDFDDPEALIAELSNRPLDLIHVHPGPSRVFGQSLAQKRGIPLMITYHGAWLDKVGTYWQQMAAILGVSPAVNRLVLKQAPGAKKRLHLMPNTTHPTQTPPTRQERNSWNIVVPSRFDADKKQLVDLIQGLWDLHAHQATALSAIPLQWHLAGAGTELPHLEECARDLERKIGQSCVTFHGWLPQDRLQALYSRSDFAVAPGRSALDALGFGLPTIAIGSAGCFGLVTPENYLQAADANFGGYGVQASQTPPEVFAALIRMMEHPEQFSEIRGALRDLIEEHHHQDMWNARLLALYQKHLTGKETGESA